MEYNGVHYQTPEVFLLNESGIGVAEIAARTCYDSFSNSDHEGVRAFPSAVAGFESSDEDFQYLMSNIRNMDESGLLHDLSWTHFHHSILEHITLSYFVSGTSRGVLQEHARHRMQAISVRSTRYTMSDIINYFLVAKCTINDHRSKAYFVDNVLQLDMLVFDCELCARFEIEFMYSRLEQHFNGIGMEAFLELTVVKKNIAEFLLESNHELALHILQMKKKRNVGDSFKYLVTDNWKVDMVVTFNLRSLKNYFDLRDSGAAWFQIQWLAQAMKDVTPQKYLDLIVRD